DIGPQRPGPPVCSFSLAAPPQSARLSMGRFLSGGSMRRRAFITLLGGTAATWPLAARAQQVPKRMLRVGALIGFAEHDPATQRRVAAFLKGLAALGWTLDRNVAIDFRYGAGDA